MSAFKGTGVRRKRQFDQALSAGGQKLKKETQRLKRERVVSNRKTQKFIAEIERELQK